MISYCIDNKEYPLFGYSLVVYFLCRHTVSSWSGGGPENRIKLIGMIGSYNPEAFPVLDNPATENVFPFRSLTNPFCVGDRVQINQSSQMNRSTAQVLDPSQDFEKVYYLLFYIWLFM